MRNPFRPAHQRADRHFPLQQQWRAALWTDHNNECRPAVRNCARQSGDLAPVIREPILGGSGQISGSFTVEQANDMAILLRAGALPAPDHHEERTVGPALARIPSSAARQRRMWARFGGDFHVLDTACSGCSPISRSPLTSQ